MGQNVVFLAQSLRALPFVRSVDFIDVGDQGAMPPQIQMDGLGARLMRQEEAGDAVDVIIELAGMLDPAWLALQRKRGKKVVYYCVGHPYAGLVQNGIFDLQGAYPAAGRCDETWLLPMFAKYAPMMRSMSRCEVRLTPYLWSPQFIQARVDEIGKLGYHYGWVPNKDGGAPRSLRVAMFEPNVAVVKTSSISMLACDEAYRAEPASIGMMNVLNTLHLKDHPTMLYFANSLDLVKEHKACFRGRDDIAGFMAQYADAVISHQWDNPQNYSYMDALLGDYPLIHNSPWLNEFGAGYYYPGFEAAEGGRQLINAWREHDQRLPDQRRARQALFSALDPLAPVNLQEHARLLQQLCQDAPALMEAGR